MKDSYPIKAGLAVLVVTLSVSIGAGFPIPAQAATEKALEKTDELTSRVTKEHRKKIRKENDLKLKARVPEFPEQAKDRAKDYRATAEIVARQGGDAKPLLDAADYFDSQSELISNSKRQRHLPDAVEHTHKPVVPGEKPAR